MSSPSGSPRCSPSRSARSGTQRCCSRSPGWPGLGYTEERFKEMQAGMGLTYAISFLCWLVMATVLASIAPHFGDGVGATLHMGLMLWLGFGATVGLTNNRFSGTPIVVWIIDAGYQAVSVAIMAVVLGLWT
ncbi:MAG TPA: DUF1761 domain-containing protein [Acidobacteria bacterium]|nr:DUF1761 domain-containing protein [Acidobacteriota bacterium]